MSEAARNLSNVEETVPATNGPSRIASILLSPSQEVRATPLWIGHNRAGDYYLAISAAPGTDSSMYRLISFGIGEAQLSANVPTAFPDQNVASTHLSDTMCIVLTFNRFE